MEKGKATGSEQVYNGVQRIGREKVVKDDFTIPSALLIQFPEINRLKN